MMMNSDLTHVFVMGNQRAINHHSSETNGSIDTWLNSTKCNYIWVQYICIYNHDSKAIWAGCDFPKPSRLKPHIKDPAIKWWNVDCFKPNLVIPLFLGQIPLGFLFLFDWPIVPCQFWETWSSNNDWLLQPGAVCIRGAAGVSRSVSGPRSDPCTLMELWDLT